MTHTLRRPLLLALLLSLALAHDGRRVNAPLVPYALSPLRWGTVRPSGWMKDWALAARHGAASPERAAFAHVLTQKNGKPSCNTTLHPGPAADCGTADGWRDGRPASADFWDEDSAYWIDGMTRLGLVLDDSELQQRVREDIYAVLKNPVRGAAAAAAAAAATAAACAAACSCSVCSLWRCSDAALLLRRSTSTTPGRTSTTSARARRRAGCALSTG